VKKENGRAVRVAVFAKRDLPAIFQLNETAIVH